ncbi:unnamed protein product, partial [Mesorhabditis spiculigera]
MKYLILLVFVTAFYQFGYADEENKLMAMAGLRQEDPASAQEKSDRTLEMVVNAQNASIERGNQAISEWHDTMMKHLRAKFGVDKLNADNNETLPGTETNN